MVCLSVADNFAIEAGSMRPSDRILTNSANQNRGKSSRTYLETPVESLPVDTVGRWNAPAENAA